MSNENELDIDVIERPRPLSWSAVVAGAIAALILHFLLNLLGLGIGATNLEGAIGEDADNVGGGAFAWWAISGILAAAGGGAIAGRMAKQGAHHNTASHGLAAWALSTLVVVGAVGGMLGNGAMSAAGPLGAQLSEQAQPSSAARESQLPPQEAAALAARAEAAADGIGTGALFSFVALVTGAAAATFAARSAGSRARIGEPAGRGRRDHLPARERPNVEHRPH